MAKQPLSKKLTLEQPAQIDKYFRAAIKAMASDIHLKGDELPRMRVDGFLKLTTGSVLPEKDLETLIFEIMTPEQKDYFLENGALDFAYDIGGIDRFRINVYRSRGRIALAGRRVTSAIPAFESLHLPETIHTIAEANQGLVLVTGITGCGKSTTIASMLDHINHKRSCHIITVEDPIEFIFQDDKSLVSQREIGVDVTSYEDALRSLMREDPDVVFIGEIRDYDTLTAGLRASETGHLVFATLHSTDAYQTVARLLDLTPQAERFLVRQALVGNLKATITQRLLPTICEDPPRVPSVEIMISNTMIRKLIAEEREMEIPSVIKSSYTEGMIDFSESLRQLIEEELIDLKTGYAYAPNPEELKMALKGIRSGGGGLIG
ncbi:MAG: PilT/PilU family type 4a pilus ATPase [Planctomycetes bacterium]|nr:PilT/PilU family type 4a pilus ATPase [Planctomycetota bacterium]